MDQGSVCVVNITRAGRIRRALMGVVVLGATAAAWRVLMGGRMSLETVALFPPVAFGWLCVMQAASNT